MEWIYQHSYATAIIGALLVLVLGAFVVERSTGVIPQRTGLIWGSTEGSLFDATSYQPQELTLETATTRPGGTSIDHALNISLSSDINIEQSAPDFNFDAFLAELSTTPAAPTPNGNSQLLEPGLAYSFIPSGLISTSTTETSRSALQQELFDYGNTIGSYVLSFEARNRNMTQDVKGHIEDRFSKEKAAALVRLANGIIELGTSLSTMDSVPR